jgi:hypothetical protein
MAVICKPSTSRDPVSAQTPHSTSRGRPELTRAIPDSQVKAHQGSDSSSRACRSVSCSKRNLGLDCRRRTSAPWSLQLGSPGPMSGMPSPSTSPISFTRPLTSGIVRMTPTTVSGRRVWVRTTCAGIAEAASLR